MPANASGDKERQRSGRGHPAGPRIVAGADGSPSSMSALRWAIRQAGLTGAVVDAVIAWNYPASAGGYGWAPTGTGNFDFKGDAEKVLAGAISAAAGPGSAVAVHARIVEGDPAQALLAASAARTMTDRVPKCAFPRAARIWRSLATTEP
jgi:nucleotide-binding universal stress UspA family protein